MHLRLAALLALLGTGVLAGGCVYVPPTPYSPGYYAPATVAPAPVVVAPRPYPYYYRPYYYRY